MWASQATIHALILDPAGLPLPFSTPVEHGQYPAFSPSRPEAARFERAIRDLWGHAASGGTDPRPSLDHGQWPLSHPLGQRPGPAAGATEPPEFPPGEAEGLMQLPLGPVHGFTEEAAHLRLTLRGETIVRAEARLGYGHKGVLGLMRGKSPRAGARFAARLAGAATVAHSLAFATAAESASGVAIPSRAAALRVAMAEIERIAVHLDDLAWIAEAADLPLIHAAFGVHRETLLRACYVAFGHRLMMDCVVPGGLSADIAPGGAEALLRAFARLQQGMTEIARLTPSLLAKAAGLGRVNPADTVRLAVGGIAGRAAGRPFDARLLPHSLYAGIGLEPIIATPSDAAARCQLRLEEIARSLRLAANILNELPEGAFSIPMTMETGEGIGCAESPQGDIWHWLQLDHGQIAACFVRDPGWALWPLLETTLPGTSVQDVPILCRSLGLAASGIDL
jgi:Ni,Fe-hydrogenase III large subunit